MSDVKKMTMTRAADSTVTWAFGADGADGTLAGSPSQFPDNIREYFTNLGFATAARNSTIGSEKGSVGSPAEMFARMKARFEQWMRGELRVTATGEERPAINTIIVDAALVYKRMMVAIKAGASPADPAAFKAAWEAIPAETDPEAIKALREKLDAWDGEIVNAAEIEAARTAARAKGADEDAAAKKAERTKLDEFKARPVFELAKQAVADQRAAAKTAAAAAKAAKAIAEGDDL